MCVSVFVSVCVYAYVYAYTYMYVYMYIYKYIYLFTYIYTYIYIYIYICIYLYKYILTSIATTPLARRPIASPRLRRSSLSSIAAPASSWTRPAAWLSASISACDASGWPPRAAP